MGFDIADELVREGLLAVSEKGRDDKPWYEFTDAAVRLVNAKMIKRINRAKADLYASRDRACWLPFPISQRMKHPTFRLVTGETHARPSCIACI